MPFDLENKITWKELAPSLQSLFKTLQQQITKNANDIENLMGRMDEAEDRLDEHDTQIAYLYSISQKFEIVGEKNGYPIGINTINLEDGTQLISQYWVERHFTSGRGNPETGFVITFPRPMDRVLTVQVEDTYYSTAARGLGWVDGEWWIRSSTMNGAGFQINYDSVHETDDNHTFQFYCMCTGYVLTGEAPKPPEIGPGEGGGGDTGGSLDDRFNGIQDQIDKLLNDIPIGTVRYAYVIPDGWLEMNGQLVSRTEYSDLFSWATNNGLMISDDQWSKNYKTTAYASESVCNKGLFSNGNGSTTFRLPDYRARFIRGLDNDDGYDPNRILGTEQLPTLIPGYDDQYYDTTEGDRGHLDVTLGYLGRA